MSQTSIGAVIFDMGGTLEEIHYDTPLRLEATRGFRKMLKDKGLDPGLEIADLYELVNTGTKKYGLWRDETEIELPAGRIWSEYALVHPGLAPERVAANGEDLALYYDLHFFKRELRPETRQVLECLRERGYRLGVISNTYSRRAVPINLARYELTEYFETVVTSSPFGWRKPNPRIFMHAAQQMRLPPGRCAYVGDTVSRDVAGARRAGYGLAIQIKSFLTGMSDTDRDIERPDAVVSNLMEVPDIVARREETNDDH